MTARVLIVEDEPKLGAVMRDYLLKEGHSVEWLDSGALAVQHVRDHSPDVVLLDVMLPMKDGLTICREVRAFSMVPIIMVTARVEEIDRLMGLDLGADDYVCKPFSPRELMARVRAQLRRLAVKPGQQPLELDAARVSAKYHGVALTLTAVEFRLLAALAAASGRVLSRNQLMDAAYVDHRVVSDRTVDTHVKNLRKKMTDAHPGDDPIHSIYGMGYKLEV